MSGTADASPARRPRVLLVGLFHESHSFLDSVTTWDDFTVTCDEAIWDMEPDESPVAGVLAVAREANWDLRPTIDLRATPSGPVDQAVFERFWSEFEARAQPELEAGVDGLFAVLHGAMATTALDDVEGEFLRRVRALPGAAQLPVFGVLDLHANVTPRMCALADGLVTYRENPHTDAKAAAVRGARLLARTLATGQRPRMTWCRVPLLWAPPGTGTADGPMRALLDHAKTIEAADTAIWSLNIAAGFSFTDTAHAGLTLTAVHDRAAERTVREQLVPLAQLAWSRREDGVVSSPTPASVLAQPRPAGNGPILLVEPADNIGAGAPGDGTGVLRALLQHGRGSGLVALWDPAAVQAFADAEPGQSRTVAVGGKSWAADEGPVELELTLVSRSDGQFTLEDPHSHLASMSGLHFAMGPCVVVRHGELTLLLTSERTPPFDLGQFRSQGIEPRDFDFIGVKAAVAHRQAYNPIALASHWVHTPGPCSSDLSTFPYHRLCRPVYPLDQDIRETFTIL